MDNSKSQEASDLYVPSDLSASATSIKRGRAVSEPSPHDIVNQPSEGGEQDADTAHQPMGLSEDTLQSEGMEGKSEEEEEEEQFEPQLKRQKYPSSTPLFPHPHNDATETKDTSHLSANESAVALAPSYSGATYDDAEYVLRTPNRARQQHADQEEHDEDYLVTPATFKTSESDMSSSSSFAASSDDRHLCLSPVPSSSSIWRMEGPPAPPSTPASNPSVLSYNNPQYGAWDAGIATPLPIRASVRNATFLEQEQQLRKRQYEALTQKHEKQHGYQPQQKQQSYQQQQQQQRHEDEDEEDPLMADGAATPAPTARQGSHAAAGTNLRGGKIPPPDDFSDWAVGDRYDLIRILGRGSYGEVAQAVDKSADKPDAFVAIKRIQSPFDQEVDAIRIYREMHILRRMRGHECIIQLLDVVPPPTDDLDDFHDLYLVFECEYTQRDVVLIVPCLALLCFALLYLNLTLLHYLIFAFYRC
jgi:Protein kinase domain